MTEFWQNSLDGAVFAIKVLFVMGSYHLGTQLYEWMRKRDLKTPSTRGPSGGASKDR